MVLTRRAILGTALLAASGARAFAQNEARSFHAFGVLERRFGGRLGVAVLDTETGLRKSHRADERFAMCSTFKFLAAAFVLARVDRGEESLSRRVTYSADDLLSYAPKTRARIQSGMTVGELCEAAVTLSDNTAANLLLASFGGPVGLTRFMRANGDDVTRLHRTEPTLNEAAPGDPRDTTTPAAMLEALHKFVLGDALSAASRAQLTDWLINCRTGDARLRAGAPAGWRIGDKTGTGDHNTANDIAVCWPPGRAPVIVAAYYTGSQASEAERDAVLAEVGRVTISVE